MSMKPEFLCCIGAELKDEIAGSLKSSRIFMYRAAESQTISDMLVDGFFNEADDLRVNDLILLYCPEKTRAFTYAKVSSVAGGVVKTTTVNIDPQDILIDTTSYSNISGSNLKQVLDSIDAEFSKYLKLDGSTTMTGVLKMRASVSFECAVAPYWHGVGLYKLNDNDSVTLLASMEATDGFEPGTNNTYNIGSTSKKWKNLYLAGSAYISKINNGYDIAVPMTNSADTLALKSQVDLAANSGSQLYTTGVWYAKMYAATVVPTGAEYDGRKYADFSQVDNDNNPVIKIYTGASGAWTLTETITPPATYNGYITVTSKIWDIAEQAGQQGGEVLWDYTHKTFTPYPRIVSFDSINVTGESTVTMPATPVPQQIVNKDYVDNALINHGTGRNVGDIFFTMRTDNGLNGAVECDGSIYNTTDFTGAQSIGQLLEAGKVPYVSLAQYATLLSTNGSVGVFGWDGTGTTTVRVPSLNDIFIETGTAAQIGDYLAPSIPNLKGYLGSNGSWSEADGTLFKTSSQGNEGHGWDGSSTGKTRFSMDASEYSSVYKDSATTVQPNAVRYRAMVQLAISATDAAVETCTQVLADVATLNTHKVIAFQAPTAQNNYTWYRLYADGWVEQGGYVDTAASEQDITINLPVPMANTNYKWNVGIDYNATTTVNYKQLSLFNRTTTTVDIRQDDSITKSWEVKGMAQQ